MLMFKNARIKLTFWYALITMIISLAFSVLVYRNVMGEVSRDFRIRSLRTSFITNQYLADDQKLFEDVRERLIEQLAIVDLVILIGSGTAGYFLAGKTLHPIEVVMEDQKRFIGDASHELRTPLTSIKTEIEVNLRDKKLNLKDAKELLKSNLEEVNKMQMLSNYLLSLSRYEDSANKLTKNKVYLNKLANLVVSRFETRASEKNIKLLNNVPEISFLANETSIEELLSILVDNAIKYNSNKGKVKIIAKDLGKNIVIKVSDNGIGIKGTDMPYIFNRFYRADSSRGKIKNEGYGLGLSIARQIVEMHKGKIDVESEIGKGSTFKVVLPKSF